MHSVIACNARREISEVNIYHEKDGVDRLVTFYEINGIYPQGVDNASKNLLAL